MRRMLVSVVASGVIALAMTPGAHAATHGCISVGGVVNVTSGSGGPVTQSSSCDFSFTAGDTYSGVGDFTLKCVLAGVVKTYAHALTAAPANQTPFTCDEGITVLLKLQPGAIVAAGNVQ